MTHATEAPTEAPTEELTPDPPSARRPSTSKGRLALLIAWADSAPHRVGEIALLSPGKPMYLGRGSSPVPEGGVRVVFCQQRPGVNHPTGALTERRLSRQQLRIEVLRGDRISVEVIGRCPTLIRGEPFTQTTLSMGDTLHLQGQLLLQLTERPAVLPQRQVDADFPFGTPDADGLVGESPALWHLRAQLGFIAPRAGHTLIFGASGSGKELVARALHRRSPRGQRPLVSRNAATLPHALIDAELFGNLRNYPNPGMAEREGLVGAATDSTLFLDEIGELPEAQQAHLLRVMDGGEYQRLGESRARKANLRVVGATNRSESHLKPDFAARFRHRLHVPDLDARRDDVPLLAGHLLRLAAAADPPLAARFLDPRGHPRFDVDVIDGLLHHPLALQTRDLDRLLWQCLAQSEGDAIQWPADLGAPVPPPPVAGVDPATITRQMLQDALDSHDGARSKVWRALGLRNRYALRRLLRKHGID